VGNAYNCATLKPLLTEDSPLAEKRKYQVGDRQVSGQPVEFESIAEPYCQFKLEDGSNVKAKMTLLNAARLDEYSDNGDPLYQFQFQQIIAVVVPEALKRKKQ
jgi:hypothetical protein